MVLEIIGTIIFGAVIGMLARLVMPGKQNISALVTVILGVLGALVGYYIWGAPQDDSSIDWLRWITSIMRPRSSSPSTARSAIAARASDASPNGPRPDGALSCPTPRGSPPPCRGTVSGQAA